MELRQQLALMDKIIRELDDLKNSQTSVLKKIAQIEADNINLGSDLLNDALPDIHEKVDDGIERVSALQEQFQMHRDQFEKDNKLDQPETTG
jgi:hypothetical protein